MELGHLAIIRWCSPTMPAVARDFKAPLAERTSTGIMAPTWQAPKLGEARKHNYLAWTTSISLREKLCDGRSDVFKSQFGGLKSSKHETDLFAS